MVTRADVRAEAYNAVQSELRIARPNADPWPDSVALGKSDGSGYGFDRKHFLPFVRRSYKRMKDSAVLNPVSDGFSAPSDLPAAELLQGDVHNLERWIAANVADQLKL